MNNRNTLNRNLAYQEAASPLGGSYTENKIVKLRLPDLAGKRFLDLGCNAGFYCKYALDRGASRVVGVDADKNVIAQAKEKHTGIQFFDTGWDIFPNETFDVITCLSAIHYARDPVALVQNVWSHLSEGGIFILEGGVIDVRGEFKTDILIPSWRTVGDRCRHLSRGFIESRLLIDFDWKVIGPSEPRAGDDVPRYVIHAVRKPFKNTFKPSSFHIDLLEYARCLSLSSKTIAPTFASYSYVKALANVGEIKTNHLNAILSTDRHFSAFVDDILFALEGLEPRAVRFHSSLTPSFLQSLATTLSAKNISVKVESKTMGEYVLALKDMEDNLNYGDLNGKVVADLLTCDPNIHEALLQVGVIRCYVIGDSALALKDTRLVQVSGSPCDAEISQVDAAFVDARTFTEINSVTGLSRLMQHMKRVLKPLGLLFAVLKTGEVNHGFDVYNSIVQTPSGPLPSPSYLFDEILRNYSVRILDRIPSTNSFEAVGFYRISAKKPTLLLILGGSQSGKTSLAREFIGLDSHMHVSNDYIYYEIACLKGKGVTNGLSERIATKVGSGGGENCGRFNRELESDVDLLNDYLRVLLPLIPANKTLVTMDWDLIKDDHVSLVKNFFTNAGFSVWTIMR